MQKIPAKEVATDREVFGASDLDQSLKEIKGQKFMDYVNVKDFGAKGDGVTDDSRAIQNAINYCAENGGGTVFFPKNVYAINPANQIIKIKENVILDLNYSTIKRIGTNKTYKMIRNYDYGSSIITKNIGVINGTIIGTGDTEGVSDQGAGIGFFGAENVILENLKIFNTNGDGIQWRMVDRIHLKNIKIDLYGRNGLSPTSGRKIFLENVRIGIDGGALPNANPGIAFDSENNSENEITELIMIGCKMTDATFVDFYTPENGLFSHKVKIIGCDIGIDNPNIRGLRFKSSNHTYGTEIFVDDTTKLSTKGNTGKALEIENISGFKINCDINYHLNKDGDTVRGILLEGVKKGRFNNMKINGIDNGFTGTLDSIYATTSCENIIINNCNIDNRIYFKDALSIEIKNTKTNTLRFDNTASNIIINNTTYNTLDLTNGVSIDNFIFGNSKGKLNADNIFSRKINFSSNTTISIPLPEENGDGNLYTLYASASHQGRTTHYAELIKTILVGSNNQSVLSTIIDNNDSSDNLVLTIDTVTQNSIQLSLNTPFTGVLSVTLIN